ncbi:MAG: two-component system, LytTR family, sensor kinase [Thermoanaerobaculia bacterium]|jgi:signal transduction histidine kinase|nr:two-component system, LytTR family, sensor kinase [Thermoanaerobaculia bacterium]
MKRRTIALIIAGWTLLALLFAAQLRIDASYAGRTLSMPQALVLSFAGWYGWALLSPLVILLARRLGTRGAKVALHIPAALVLTFVKVAVTTEILRRAGFSPRSTFSIANVPLNLITYAAIVVATHGIATWRRGREANALLMQARLDLLTSQLQPHFLFNALHSIAELMHSDVEAADRALTRVSELLRATLDAGKQQEIRLADELALVDRYLEIEQIRLGDRLRTRIDVEPSTRDALVPMFILQPIVENAVRHAIAPRTAPGTIVIATRHEGDDLRIEIADDGSGFAADEMEGVGLANTRARLAHLYGDKQRLEIARNSDDGASVRLVLPFRT